MVWRLIHAQSFSLASSGSRYISGTKATFRLVGMDMGPPRLPPRNVDLPVLDAVLRGLPATENPLMPRLSSAGV